MLLSGSIAVTFFCLDSLLPQQVTITYLDKWTLVHSKFHSVDISLIESQTLYSHHYTRTDTVYHNALLHSLYSQVLYHWTVQARLDTWSLQWSWYSRKKFLKEIVCIPRWQRPLVWFWRYLWHRLWSIPLYKGGRCNSFRGVLHEWLATLWEYRRTNNRNNAP